MFVNKLIIQNVNNNTVNNGKVLISNTLVCNNLLGTNFISKGNNLTSTQLIQVIHLVKGLVSNTIRYTKRLPYGNNYRTITYKNGCVLSTGTYKNRKVIVLNTQLLLHLRG